MAPRCGQIEPICAAYTYSATRAYGRYASGVVESGVTALTPVREAA